MIKSNLRVNAQAVELQNTFCQLEMLPIAVAKQFEVLRKNRCSRRAGRRMVAACCMVGLSSLPENVFGP